MKNTELKKLANSITKQIQCYFLNTNVAFIMPEDTSFMEKFTKDVWSLCRLSFDSEKWRKVDEELPENEDDVIVKIKVDSDICSFDIARYDKLYKTFYSTSYCVDSSFEDCGNVIEWKPID